MNIEKEIKNVKKDACDYFKGVFGSHDWDHVERVYKLALHIGEKEGADLEVLKLAAYLHDIGRLEQAKTKGKVCHAEHGAKLAKEILARNGFDQAMIDRVSKCIEAHRLSVRREHKSLESKVLFDADTIDSLGAIGLGRLFSFAGSIGAKVHNKDVDVTVNHEYTTEDTPYWYFMNRGKDAPKRMFTKEGRRIAQARYEFMGKFFKRINAEVDGVK